MRAMLVAAGFGTRLDPLTRELPKPALPVANRPIAWFACDHLTRSGAREIVVNTHHLARELRAALETHAPPGSRLRFVHEPQILGTGGGVRNAWQPDDGEDFVTMNAKLLFAPDLSAALAAHRQSGAIATMVLRPLPAGATFNAVQVAADGRVLAIGGIAVAPQAAHAERAAVAPQMFTGVQILSARAWRDLPENGGIIQHSYARWLERGDLVASVTDDAPWMDVGVTHRHYLDANLALASGTLSWPGITPEPGGLFVEPSARIGRDCELGLTAIGAGADVADGTRLTRVVAWPGARVSGNLQDAVVTTAGQIVRV
jgi:mannose-1-phosphate guanylyltransferase